MTGLDVYLSGLHDDEYSTIYNQLEPSTNNSVPLLSWGLYTEHYHQVLQAAKKKNEMQEVMQMAKKYNWKNDIKTVFSEHEYEALILTDSRQRIIWVNDGFSTMTGYSKKFAVHKTPGFLQGANTSATQKRTIKNKLRTNKPFVEVLVNYRKDKTPYLCEVKIIPLHTNTTTHYLAFEREVG